MERCRQCGSEVERASRFCSQCGSPLRKSSADSSRASAADAPNMAAVTAADPPTYPLPPSSSQPASHPSRDQGRFPPGRLIAERYRIVSLLGRGGMGEVFRADDLTLGQPVALKFLPESMIDSSMLERFRNEVRIARRISHPNVCRVYDIGETDNQVFLSMEYVDGEDLSSLLRRIGRLPRDKALEIARKFCAGLAAAHDKGVLHRDLKPSNIMLDRRGEVLIMDFGLAGLVHEIEDVRSGTPAYMAPEQLAGKEVTARSDIYALGLVLYELFTGKPAFEGTTHDEIMRARRESTPHSSFHPGSLISIRAVEMVIMRCLEEEPENRPSSALIVSAALPGWAVFDCSLPPRRLRPIPRNRSDGSRDRRAQRPNGGCRCQDFCRRSFLAQLCEIAARPAQWRAARHRRAVHGNQGTHDRFLGAESR